MTTDTTLLVTLVTTEQETKNNVWTTKRYELVKQQTQYTSIINILFFSK